MSNRKVPALSVMVVWRALVDTFSISTVALPIGEPVEDRTVPVIPPLPAEVCTGVCAGMFGDVARGVCAGMFGEVARGVCAGVEAGVWVRSG